MSSAMTKSVLHATARLCSASVAQALAHLSTRAGMSRWNLGLWNCREVEPGLFSGESLFDHATAWVRVVVDAERGLVDYLIGADRAALTLRIRASVIAGETLGHPVGTCVVTLEAWRTAGMDDERWARQVHTYETEIELIRAQLGAQRASRPDPAGGAGPAAMAPRRRHISSGSPWEELAGYSRAVVDGEWVFVSGTVGLDFSTMTMGGSATQQSELALDTIERALSQAGATLMDVVRVRAFVPQREDVASVSAVLKRRLGAARPANTTVCCPLAVDDAKVEIEVTARMLRHGAD
jgi:enamine deaminase RidA (YjgF/YER057c/UK114 family)